MKELVEYIAKGIATYPDDVEETGDGEVLVTLTVNSEAKGKVIGRQGRVAQSMRVLLRVAAVKNDLLVNLEIK